MPYQELLILLPCHSLEDFPTYHEGDDADGLLSAWSAMWHPAFLASAGTKPGWCRVDSPPVELAQRLLIVPTVAQQQLPTGFAQRAKDAGACLVRRLHKRDDIVAAALAGLGPDAPAIDADLSADFMALGYCYLEVQLLTRQMRYASNLDELHFQNLVVAGARAARDGDLVLAREKLQACFDMLAEERNHYYPVEAYLLDVILVAPTTVGASLRTELATDSPASLLINGSCLEQMSAREPETMTAVCGAIQADRLSLIGGEAEERRWPLLGHESILAELRRGGTVFERLVGARPAIYGRRRFGLTPALPQILSRLGFRGTLHATLDDGRFPQGSQLKVRWEGGDGTGIDAVARPPLDASKPQTFLSLAMKLGESMDSDHVATLMLAHWPGQASPWLDVLRRVAKYSPAMGRFVSFEKYFRDTDPPGQIDRFEVDQYRSPYLKQAIIRRQVDPISSSVRYWRRRALLESLTAYDTLLTLAGGPAPVADSAEQRQRAAWAEQTDQRTEDAEPDLATAEAFDAELAAAAQRGAERLAAALPRSKSAAGPGYLLVNPHSSTRRTGLAAPDLPALPTVEKPVYAADEKQGERRVVVDVPPLGYTWLAAGTTQPAKGKPVPPLAEGLILRNEFFEVLLNQETGGLQAFHEYGARGNRLSQQLAHRVPGAAGKPGDTWQDPDETANYSSMEADSVQVTATGTTLGEITVRGRLLDRRNELLAGFTQVYRVWRGSRVLTIDIELDPKVEPQADPWNSYFACRFAWADETADLFRTVHQTRAPVTTRQFESSHYVDIVGEPKRTTLLTGGLPFHRRVGGRMLDSLLLVRGERARKFRLGVGIDLTHPMHDALSLLAPPAVVRQQAPPPAPASSWLLHLDAKSLVVTNWSPLVENGRTIGFRARVLETMGRPAQAKLSCCRPIIAARTFDFLDRPLDPLPVENGQIVLQLAGHQWIEIEGRW